MLGIGGAGSSDGGAGDGGGYYGGGGKNIYMYNIYRFGRKFFFLGLCSCFLWHQERRRVAQEVDLVLL